jgi:hypothetical protein
MVLLYPIRHESREAFVGTSLSEQPLVIEFEDHFPAGAHALIGVQLTRHRLAGLRQTPNLLTSGPWLGRHNGTPTRRRRIPIRHRRCAFVEKLRVVPPS